MSNWQTQTAAWRAEVQDWHPTPDGLDSAGYLATETGEALDSALRLKRPHDDRTNGHRRNLGRELAQVVDMTCTVGNFYGVTIDDTWNTWRDQQNGFRAVCQMHIYGANVLRYVLGGARSKVLLAETLAFTLCAARAAASAYGIDLQAEIDAWHDTVRSRRP